MSDPIKEAMEDIRSIQKRIKSKGIPEAKRAELNGVLQKRIRIIFSHADGRRASLKKSFRSPIRRSR